MKTIFDLLKETVSEWQADKASRLAAALAYYTIFSIAPLLIVVVAIAGFVAGQDAAMGLLDEQIQGLVGRESADFIQEMLKNARQPEGNLLASIIGLATLLLGAIGLFGQLKDALNTVWGIEPKPTNGILNFLRGNLLSFTMVLGIGFLLMVSLVLSAILAAVSNFTNSLLPGAEFLMQIVNFMIGFGITTLLFAMIYKVLPDTSIAWRDVWVGAAITSLLFSLGRFLIGLYLGNSTIGSTYGAAGSLAVILVWVYYSAQLLLLGAEFTQVFARRYGSFAPVPEKKSAQEKEAEAESAKPKTQDSEQLIPAYVLAQSKDEFQHEPPIIDYEEQVKIEQPEPSSRPMLGFIGSMLAVAGAAFGLLRVLSRQRED
jgi:membrane protein